MKVQNVIKEEIRKLIRAVSLMTVFMWIGFYILYRFYPDYVPFNYTVFLGGIGGAVVAVANFYFMSVAVQDVVQIRNDGSDVEKETAKEDMGYMRMKYSYTYRTLLQMAWVIIAMAVPFIQTAAGILPIFFPGIWFKCRLLIRK